MYSYIQDNDKEEKKAAGAKKMYLKRWNWVWKP